MICQLFHKNTIADYHACNSCIIISLLSLWACRIFCIFTYVAKYIKKICWYQKILQCQSNNYHHHPTTLVYYCKVYPITLHYNNLVLRSVPYHTTIYLCEVYPITLQSVFAKCTLSHYNLPKVQFAPYHTTIDICRKHHITLQSIHNNLFLQSVPYHTIILKCTLSHYNLFLQSLQT